MRGYQLPRHSGKSDTEYSSYNDESQNRDAGYPANWGQPDPVVLVPCGNLMCTKESEARYCSLYCLDMIEGTDEEPEDMSQDGTQTEADLDTLLTALSSLDPTLREYLALSLMGPEAYCEAPLTYYVAPEEPILLGHVETATEQYGADMQAGGYAHLACYGR